MVPGTVSSALARLIASHEPAFDRADDDGDEGEHHEQEGCVRGLCQGGGGGAGGAAGAGLRTCIPLTAEPAPNVSYRLAPGLDRATSLSSCEVECAAAVLALLQKCSAARRIEAMNTTGSLGYQRGCNRRHAPRSDSIGPQRRDRIHANGSPRRHVGRQR